MARKRNWYLSYIFSILALTLNSGISFAQEDDVEDPIDDGEDVELIEEAEEDIEGDEILDAGDLICLAGLYQSFETEEYSIEGSVVTYVESEDGSEEEEGYYEDLDSDELLGTIASKISSLKKKIKKATSASKKRALKRKVAALVELRGEINSCLEGEMYPEEWQELM